MRLTLRVLGLDLLDIELSTDSFTPDDSDLSGGTTVSTAIDAGQPLGFSLPSMEYDYDDE